MRVLVIGSGGREHAFVDALARSASLGTLYAAPGNAGIAELAECIDVPLNDVDPPARKPADIGRLREPFALQSGHQGPGSGEPGTPS